MTRLTYPGKFVLSIGIIISFSIIVLFSHNAAALSPSQFNPGNIIDDSVFFNTSSMSVTDIQNFLNVQVPSCDTSGLVNVSYYYNTSTGKVSFSNIIGGTYVTTSRATYGTRYDVWTNRSDGGAPFVCLHDYSQSTPSMAVDASLCNAYNGGVKSAAQILYDVSQACGINPQVLLVLLDKEQSLVTDTWPQGIQYQSATGYACPDSGPCDSNYAGFFNQIYYAARQYKKYARDSNSYSYAPGKTWNLQYNPDTRCGSSSVYIQNQATADLYIYTPYQPNAATLNMELAGGPSVSSAYSSCGAFGNINFLVNFTKWFGPTIGPLIKTADSGSLYYSDGTTKYFVPSMDIAAEYGLGLSSVRTVNQSTIDNLATPIGTTYLTQAVKSTSDTDADGGNLYLLSGGKRYLITDMSQFADFGLKLSQITYLDYSQLLRMPLAGNLSNFVRSASSGFVYKIGGGSKQGIFESTVFNTQDPSGAVIDMSDFLLSTIPTGRVIVNTKLVMKDQTGKLWLATNAGWYSISSMNVFYCLGFLASDIVAFNPSQSITDSSLGAASCAIASSDSNNYLIDGLKRYNVDPSWGFDSSRLAPMDASLLNPSSTISTIPKQVFRTTSNGALYVFEGGIKHHIYNMESFNSNGYQQVNITDVSNNLIDTISTGPDIVADGSVITDQTGLLYILINNTKYYITSMEQFAAFGLNASSIIRLSSSDIASYSGTTTLSQLYNIGSQSYLSDQAVAWQIPDSIKAHYGITSTTPAYTSTINAQMSNGTGTATRFIKASSSPTVYYLENGNKRPISSWATVVSLGGSNANIMYLSDYTVSLFPTGQSL
jgi:hypothetical protein